MSDLDYAASWDKPENEEDNVGLDYASRWKKEDDRDQVIQRKIQEQRVWRRDPKRAAEALTLANERGIPASVMYDKLEEFKRPQVDYEKMQRNAPILFGLMGNTAYTPILQSDVENMSGFEAGWNELQKRIAETSETDEMGLLGEKWSNDSATEADIKRIEEIRNLQSSRPDYELGWANPFYYAGVTAGVGLDLGLSGARALPIAGAGAAGGAVTGAGAGAALGTFTIPFVGTATGAGGGAVLGGAAGFGAGLRAGFAVDSYKKQKGLTFIELMYSFDENGNPFDRDTAKAISTSVGAINAALDVVGVEFVAKAFPGVKDMLGGKLIQTVTTNPAARNALVKMYRIAQAGLGEGTTELLQSITELETTLQAGAVFDSEGGQRAEQRSQYPTAFGEGFIGAAGLATVGQGAQSIVDARKARAEAARQRLVELGDKIRNSKVPALSPETMSEFARSLDDSNPSQMTAPVEAVVKLFQEEGFTPEQIEQRFPGLTASLEEAQQGNAEVKLKAADVVKMAQLKGYDEFTSDIRIGEAPTAKEAARLNEEGDSLIADVGAEEQRQAVQASIESEIAQQLTAAGQEQRAAQTQAKLFTSTLTNLAERAGLDVNELYNRYNLSIRGEQDGQGLEGVKLDQAAKTGQLDPAYGEPALQINGRVFKASDFFPNWERGSRPEAGRQIMSIADEQAMDNVDLGPGMPEDPFWGHAELMRKAREALGADVVDAALESDPEAGFGMVNAAGDFRSLKTNIPSARSRIEETPINRPGEGTTTLNQSGVPLFESPMPIEGKATITKVAQALTDRHQEIYSRKLDPSTSEADYNQVRDDMIEEINFQLQQRNSGVGWYSADVELAIRLLSVVFPTLRDNVAHRQLLLMYAAIFSSGNDPDKALQISTEAFETFLKTGETPVVRADAARARGVDPQMTTFKDKSGKEVTKEAGWTQRSETNEQQLAFVRYIIQREGSLEAGMNWLLNEQPRDEINRAMTESGLYQGGRFKTRAEIAGPPERGVLSFGPKLGRYAMGLQGVEIDEGDVTIDLWYIRTYRRLIGGLFDGPLDPRTGIVGQPNDTDRGVIRRLTGDLVAHFAERGYTVGDVQAVLWFYEKRLWAAHGLRLDEGTNSTGARRFLEERGYYVGSEIGEAYNREGGAAAAGVLGGQEPERLVGRKRSSRRFVSRRLGRSGDAEARLYGRRGNPNDRKVRGIKNYYVPNAALVGDLEYSGYAVIPEIEELDPKRTADFRASITAARNASEFGAAVHVYEEEEYRNMRLFLTPDKKAGFAVKEDGDIVSVFSDGGGKTAALLALAVEMGGTKLDAFDTVLPEIYAISGFKEVGRDAWNDEYKDPAWNYDTFKAFNNGRPDIVYMAYDPAYDPYAEEVTNVRDDQTRTLYQGVEPERAGDGRGRYSGGSLAPLEGAPTVAGASGPDASLVAVAEQYARDNGIDLRRQATYVEVDEDRARRIADAYEAMEHAPQDPTVKEAYANLIEQTKAQYDALVAAGYSFTFYDDATDPYAGNPWNAMRDLRQNKRMAVYGTYAGFGTAGVTGAEIDDNPMLVDTGIRWQDQTGAERVVTANDLFRAVHDAFGHGLEGAGFRARGEENAWQAHIRLYTGSAVAAVSTGTRGQNSWLNYGPYGEANKSAKVEDTVFARQKIGLLPSWVWEEGRADDEAPETGPQSLERLYQNAIDAIANADLITNTPEFRRWFGNSVVVDPDGKPLIVYHGSERAGFTVFNTDGKGEKTKGTGAFFSNKLSNAMTYSGDRRLVDLSGGEAPAQQGNVPVFLKIEKPLVIDAQGQNWSNVDGRTTDEIIREARASGEYDGVIFRNLVDEGQYGWYDDASDVYVTFEPSQIKSVQNQGTFDPANPNILKQKARGFITFTDARNKFEITLTGKANLSTFVHESAHFFLEVMQDLVARGEAPQQLVQDLSIIKSWMGIAPEKKAGPAGKIEVKHHEKFARAFEAYLREGRAPDNALQDIFNRFRAWLVFIYKKMRALDVELTDEVRGVFDRLVASDAAIAEARTQLGWSKPMPQDALALTDEEYARYVETWQKASDEQSRELDERMMREAADARKDAWKQETERRVGEEIAALKKTRGYKAWKALTEGEGLEDIGRTALKIDPESVPSEWRRDTVGMTEEGGMPLEVVAELLGFQSGEAMLQLIGGAKFALRDIPIKVKKAMEAEHGHLDATALADAASEAVIKPVGEVLLSEYRALAASAGIRVEPGLSQWMAATAKRKVQALTQRQLEPSRWRRAELKSAKESAAAAAKGDKQKAALAKRQQMMAAAMYRATIDAQKRIDTIQSKLTPFTKDKRRAQLGKAGDTYLDAIDEILEGISFKNVTAKSLEKQNRLAAFLKEAEEKELPVNIPDYLTSALGKRNYSTMTLEELEGVHDTVMSIWHLAKKKNELRANKEKRDIENFLAEMAVNAERAMGAPEVDKDFVKGIRQRAKDGLRHLRSQITKLEFMFGWLDGTTAGGLTHRFIYQPLVDANFEKFKILKRYQKTLVERLRNLPAKQRTRWNTKRMFMGGQADGATIIAAALNLGNEANKQKLLDGYGWDEARLMAEINAFMKKEDWDLVQHIWDEIDTMWPKIVEVTKAATGLAPERVEALPVQTPFGQYRGGYYPVVYDPSRTERVFQNQQKTEGLFSNNYLKPKLGDGFTKGRTNYSAPILLDIGVIPRHLAQVVHYVTHYEAIDQINRITSHPRFEEIVSGHMGKDFYRLLRPWLQDIAKDQDTPPITRELYVSRVLQYLRGGMSITAMGFNLVTGFKQLYGVTTALDAIPLKFWAKGVAKSWLSPKAFSHWKEALDKSKELRPLIEQVDRDIYMMNRMYQQNIAGRAKDAAIRYAFAHIGYFQLAVNVATWHGAFQQAISEGKPEPEAVNIADAIVRQTQSAGAVKDLSKLQRGSEAERMFTMFYSWFNVLYNRLEDIARTTGSIRDVPRAAKRLAILVFYSAILEETIGRGWEALMGEDEEDDEDVGYILSVLYRGLDQLVVAIPGVSFFVRGETTPPALTVIRDAERALKAAEKIAIEQEMLSQAEGRAIARFVSTTFQLPVKGIYDLLADVYDVTADQKN